MGELIDDGLKALYRFITNRLLWLFIIMAVLFYVMLARLFELQIVLNHTFVNPPPITTTVEQFVPASRGNIYDRLGRPLAVNTPVWVVTVDPSIAISNEALLELSLLFERNNEDFVNDFPMTTVWPYDFTLGGNNPETRQWREFRWKDDMGIPNPETATAAEAFLHLRAWFGIDPEMTNEDARRILNFRCMIFERRFRPQIFVLATDVSHATIAAIEERSATLFTGVDIGVRNIRVYPQGIYFSHMLGYVGTINAEELAANPDYAHDDIIGKMGLERSMEAYLRGIQGTQVVEINPNTGRRVGTLPEITLPVAGNNIFLTIDADMQIQTYYILKEYLTEIVIRRIQGNIHGEEPVTHQHILNNLFQAGWISIRDILDADESSAAYILRHYITSQFPEANALRENRTQVLDILTEGINSGRITSAMVFTAMVDMGILSDDNNFSERANMEGVSANALIIEKLRIGELTPQMINVDPATGSVVVVDVRTGAVLAAVTYPSYDNNRLANRMDSEYFFRINMDDPTHPMMNRPFVEARAPGSTFKMITAIAGLESGVIGTHTTIQDGIVFTRAGRPHARCMSHVGHGRINVEQAISTSCNYFFFETAFRLGDSSQTRIEALNRYMSFFGLNERTGVEIGELADTFNRDNVADIMASPAFKRFMHLSRNPFAPSNEWAWFDGDTIRTAIGQSYNNYSTAMMARYIAQIANNGVRFPLHLVDTIENPQGVVIHRTTPVPDDTGLEFADSTWTAVQNGMLQATEGWGTATNHFRNFPIQVAGKTGTAEQVGSRLSHTSFGGYAPFDNPQISVYVNIPFGATRVMPSAATQVARDVIGAFLMPEIEIERPIPPNVLVR
ncbi:MAG: penicillin-binding transpeptidase domain-containing protein [Defluviitaleaceae bacterium]|nr:penicillin-binding transpeptidase domain-containing protein [Defluviitaleaceae bacterium]